MPEREAAISTSAVGFHKISHSSDTYLFTQHNLNRFPSLTNKQYLKVVVLFYLINPEPQILTYFWELLEGRGSPEEQKSGLWEYNSLSATESPKHLQK